MSISNAAQLIERVAGADQTSEAEIRRLLNAFLTRFPEADRSHQLHILVIHLQTHKELSPRVRVLVRLVYGSCEDDLKEKLMARNALTRDVIKMQTKSRKPPRNQDQEAMMAMKKHWPDDSCGVPSRWKRSLEIKGLPAHLRALYGKCEALGLSFEEGLWGASGLLTAACAKTGTFSVSSITTVQKQLPKQPKQYLAVENTVQSTLPLDDQQGEADRGGVEQAAMGSQTPTQNEDEGEGGAVSDSDAGSEVSCDLGSPASTESESETNSPSPQRGRHAPVALADHPLDDDVFSCGGSADEVLAAQVYLQDFDDPPKSTASPCLFSSTPVSCELTLPTPTESQTIAKGPPPRIEAVSSPSRNLMRANIELRSSPREPKQHGPHASPTKHTMANVLQRTRRRTRSLSSSSVERKRRKLLRQENAPVLVVDEDESRGGKVEEMEDLKLKQAIECLRDGQCLNTDTIDRLLRFVADSTILILESASLKFMEKGPSRAESRLAGARPEIIIIPYEASGHWVCAFVEVKAKKLEVINSMPSLDSMHPALIRGARQAYARYVGGAPAHSSRNDEVAEQGFALAVETSACPRQTNLVDCGIFVVTYCWYRLYRQPFPDHLDTTLWRRVFRLMLGSEEHELARKPSTTNMFSEYKDFDLFWQCAQPMVRERQVLQDILSAHLDDVEQIRANLEDCQRYLSNMESATKAASALPKGVIPSVSREQLEVPRVYMYKLTRLLSAKRTVGVDNNGARRALEFVRQSLVNVEKDLKERALDFMARSKRGQQEKEINVALIRRKFEQEVAEKRNELEAKVNRELEEAQKLKTQGERILTTVMSLEQAR
ncbi:hypothetical protein LTR96_011269 [Exophiala xenobiotica]|nr:hypothetical protein LTR72_011608 [Exophiala xenobiotica]KAK5263310.1 hypothetical protein LTR96_011269 [Exophiala xenobiotica]KAK5284852.1 hypothetical protein LTR14_011440 [Exophiala xenobiotica]KAK5332644.1 hypothetical protein LTR98_011230 [Exophiala xenobiotica]KAK5469004.1 hypothetical protein LTR55_011460 [Exophiala xenobiotica]